MSSKSRNFRRRAGTGDDDDDPANATTSTTSSPKPSAKTSSVAAKPKKIHQKLLSFADDEDGDAAPAPSSRSSSAAKSTSRVSKVSGGHHKITVAKDRVTPSASSASVFSSSLPSNVQPQAGQYTKEALLELQRNTKTLRPPAPPPSQRKPSAKSAEPVIVLKGLIKPANDNRKGGAEEAEQEEEAERSTEREEDETERKLGLMGIGGIPDQATINAIKARKEKARKLRAPAPDFISLDMGSNHGEAEGLSDEEPEFQSRTAMFGEKVDGPRKGVFEDVDELALAGRGAAVSGEFVAEVVEDEEDDDEEERKWEEEQFRKGLGKRMDDGGAAGLSSNAAVVQPVQKQKIAGVAVGPHPVSNAPVGPPSIGGALASEVMPIAQQADVAKRALQDNMRRLKESHGKTMITVHQMDENLSASLTNITSLEEALSAAGEKFIFMQKLRDFVSVICDFLQHKAPYIEELEDQMQQLHKERASAVLERRTADNHDEMFEAEAAVSAAMSVFNKGGSSTATTRAASAAAQAAIDALKEQRLPAELDEMGRDLNLQKRMDMTRRAAARQRRRSRLDNKRMSSIANGTAYHKIDGESSTDESDGEDAAYKSHRDLLLQTAEHVFSDAAEEYSQLSAVQERFDKWKKVYLRSYNDAYMTLSVPAIFSPYVRLDFLKWDPLHEYVDFSDMKWHSVLFDYGRTEDGNDPDDDDDDDANLVPGLVEKIAIPILHYEITHCWDILSTKETKNAVLATVLVAAYVPSSEALKKLVTAVRDRLADSVANLVVPTWSALVLKAVPTAARLAAYRFGVAVRLLRNICLWKEILALPVLEKLALDELLAGKILPHVRSITSDVHDAVTRTERVVDSLSGIWAGGSVTSARRKCVSHSFESLVSISRAEGFIGHNLPVLEQGQKLQPLVDHIVTLGRTLERRYASGVSEGGTIELVHRLKKMLKDLNEYDQARAMLRTFNIKEAV